MTALTRGKLDKLFAEDHWAVICGVLVTMSTGEGAFAYDLESVEVWGVNDALDHTDCQTWCDEVSALDDPGTALAIWAASGIIIDKPGLCTPVVEITAAHRAGLKDAEDAEDAMADAPLGGDLDADEALVNALSDGDLAGTLGIDPEDLRDEDGDWTQDTLAALGQYSAAHRARGVMGVS